jgi:hypothetical protein
MHPLNNRLKTGWKQQWLEIGGKRLYARSKWEANYACYLEFCKENGLIKDWLHEPRTWWFDGIKRGVVSYLPDFEIIHNNGTFELREVKGYLDAKSKTKIARMAKYYPHIILKVIDKEWFKANTKQLKQIVKGWQ